VSNEELVSSLVLDGYLKTARIIQAFKKINRADFVPEKYKKTAYSNEPLLIGEGQTISQPLTVAFMLELLDPQPEEKILDVGAGSGWQSALLAEIVGESGRIFAAERLLKLKAFAEKNINKYGFIKKGIVKILWEDGSKGVPLTLRPIEGFDKIIAAAAIYPRESAFGDLVPEAWKEQLKIGGRVVVPIGQSIFVFDKTSATEFEEKEYYGFSFVPLIVD